MMMIDKSIKRNLAMVCTARGQKARRVYLRTKFLWAFSLVGLVLITFFEKPQWCLEDPRVAQTSDCLLESDPKKFLTTSKSKVCLLIRG